MNVLIDTNVIIDVLVQRKPFFEHSQLVLLASEQKLINGFVSATAVTDIFYVVRKHYNKADAHELMKKHLIGTVSVAAVDEYAILKALEMEWNDFEDCVQYVVSENISADYIVTRNPKDFQMKI